MLRFAGRKNTKKVRAIAILDLHVSSIQKRIQAPRLCSGKKEFVHISPEETTMVSYGAFQDGTEGKLTVLPPTEELQEGDETRHLFIQYSCRDAEATWFLRESLEQNLRAEQCVAKTCPLYLRI
jgi:hypothetical protein